jgi:hypothetical protein
MANENKKIRLSKEKRIQQNMLENYCFLLWQQDFVVVVPEAPEQDLASPSFVSQAAPFFFFFFFFSFFTTSDFTVVVAAYTLFATNPVANNNENATINFFIMTNIKV